MLDRRTRFEKARSTSAEAVPICLAPVGVNDRSDCMLPRAASAAAVAKYRLHDHGRSGAKGEARLNQVAGPRREFDPKRATRTIGSPELVDTNLHFIQFIF